MSAIGNRLIDSLSPALAEEFTAASRAVDLPLRARLGSADELPFYSYLLTSGAASVVVVTGGGGSSEVGMIGNEGLIGASALLGSAPMVADTFMQLEGKGLRIPTRTLRGMFEESAELRGRILQFVQYQMNTSSQISACNRLHEAEERLARWLMIASDLTQSDTLGLTQDFVAQMLGSQRTTVALVAGVLQRDGLIQYSRGKVRILNREGLRDRACDCYRITSDALIKLYA